MNPPPKSFPAPQSEVAPAGETVYMIDSRGNLIIETGSYRTIFTAAGALELLKFLERTGYQAHANRIAKGVPA